MLKTVSSIATQIISSITGGLVQFTGPAAGSTRVITVPNANATMARTDAAQSFTDDQTLSTGNLVVGTSIKGVTTSGANALRFGTNGSTSQATLTTGSNITLGSTDLPYLYADTSNAKGVANLNAGLGKCLAGGVSSVAASGGTADFNVGFFAMGFLLVNNEVEGGATQRTQTTFSVFTRGGDNFTATQIATANGSGGGASFTVSWVGTEILRITNTQGNICNVSIAYFGL
jgi:hypothetical protein